MDSLTNRISERLSKKSGFVAANNRVVILKLVDDIRSALEDGWSMRVIYQVLYEEGAIIFSYQTFRRYVNELILRDVK